MRTAKLFQNGQSQAVRLPKEFRFTGKQVFIKKIGNAVMLIPYQNPWQALMDSLDKFSADFMTEREQPTQQVREDLFA
jgi:antitoxin VapB